MTAGDQFLVALRRFGLVSDTVEFSPATLVDVAGSDGEQVVDEGPPWWMDYPHDRYFSFQFDRIAQHQMDDNLLDVVAPVVEALGLVLTHDWNAGPQHDDPYREDTGLRIWINGEPVTYPFPHGVNCMRPLELVNWLMRSVGITEQFCFSGVQWTAGRFPSFYFESVDVVLLSDEMFEFLRATPAIDADVTRPVRMSEVVGTADSWTLR